MDEQHSFFKALINRLTKFSNKFEYLNAVASVLLSVLFVLTTYDIDSGNNIVIWYIETFIIIYLFFDWFLMLFMADNRLAYLFTPQSLISYITLAASAFCLISEDVELIDTYELKAMKVVRVLSISRIEEVLKRKNMPLGTAVFRLVFESVALIMIFASAMLRTENRWFLMPLIEEARAEDPDWEENSSLYLYRFHDLIYYTVISITTTGYGDISP